MKKIFFLFLLIFFFNKAHSQKLYLSTVGANEYENSILDSLITKKNYSNAKLIQEEINTINYKLSLIGYFESEVISSKKTNDSTFQYIYNLGEKSTHLKVFIENINNKELLQDYKPLDNYISLNFSEIENFLSTLLYRMETLGYSLTKIKLNNLSKKDSVLYADLEIIENKKRTLNDIAIKGYEKFPESHSHNIKRLFKNKIFNQKTLDKVNKEFEKIKFVKQIKYPEILFLTDSTKVYVYLEKAKPNKFDGFIGFSNDKNNNLQFRGYLDLELQNFLNSGEKFGLFWKSDGNKQTTFNVALELPYLFKSPFGLKSQLNIFKQDSTFQNTKTNIDLGYYFNYNKKIYLGYQSTESNDINNLNTSSLYDYKNSFFTGEYEYSNYDDENLLFPEKSRFQLKTGIGKRNSKFDSNNQTFVQLQAFYNLYLNNKNILNLKTQNYYLQSDTFIINELYRFGGVNSIRGFNENSLQSNFLSSILTEYRYILSSEIYVHSILDYAYFKDDTSKINEKLIGIGFGFGLLTKNGLFNIIYANGNSSNTTFKLSNSIVHISFKTSF